MKKAKEKANETSSKGFSASNCKVGNCIFSKYVLGIFGVILEFFGNSLGFFSECFGNFLGILWQVFLIWKELISLFLSRFCLNAQGRRKEDEI